MMKVNSQNLSRRRFLRTSCGAGALMASASAAAPVKIAFVAGPKSHGYGQHAHNSGCLLLAKCLHENLPGVKAVVHRDGWPADPSFFDGASAIVVFADGGAKHPMLGHFEEVDRLVKQGVGLAVLHYALIVEKGEQGDHFLDWIGGYYETHWSVNPMWMAEFKQIPAHPITRGVKPFAIRDEWYYHMRFQPDMKGVTPILTAVPPDSTRERKFGPHSGNPVVASRKGMPEHVAWAYAPPGGPRGFGFTGGHYHWAWGDDNYRTLALNGVAWAAGLDIPAGGVPSPTPSWEDLLANEEGERPAGFSQQQARDLLYPPK